MSRDFSLYFWERVYDEQASKERAGMSNHHLRITLYSHHFSVNRLTYQGRQVCFEFSKKVMQWGLVSERGRTFRKPLRIFAASNARRSEFRFHINNLKSFMETMALNYITEGLYEMVTAPAYEPADIELKMKPNWEMRDYQIPIVEYCCQKEPVSKFVSLQTGKGKSAITMAALAQKKKRFVIIVKPMFIEKWIDDMLRTLEIDKDDIIPVQGGGALKALLQKAKDNELDAKCIIISNSTIQTWIKSYEQFGDEILELGYACLPHQLCEILRAGDRIIDEVHMHYHLCFKIDLYTHVPSSISLSATLVSQDPFLMDTYKTMFPLSTRYKEVGLDKYIDVSALYYNFKNPEKIRTSEYGSNNFSNNAVEASILKHTPTLNNYLELIGYAMECSFLQVKRDKRKLIIYAYSIEMIDCIVEYIQRKYPEYDTRRYTSDDPWENLNDTQICVTTIGSAGTAVDVTDLTNIILTTSISSIQANIQVMGRLRKLSDNHPTVMQYFVAENIPKSKQYHIEKIELYRDRAKSQGVNITGRLI